MGEATGDAVGVNVGDVVGAGVGEGVGEGVGDDVGGGVADSQVIEATPEVTENAVTSSPGGQLRLVSATTPSSPAGPREEEVDPEIRTIPDKG